MRAAGTMATETHEQMAWSRGWRGTKALAVPVSVQLTLGGVDVL